MPRNLDTTLAAHLGDPVIGPAVFAEIRFRSGIERVWSGVGDFVGPNGHTFSGLGEFASVGAIGEGTDVKAEGTSVTLSGIGLSLIDVPGNPVTPPDPPFPPPAGQSVAWSFAPHPPTGDSFFNPPSLLNAFLGCDGAASGSNHGGVLAMTNGQSPAFGAPDSVALGWGGFAIPPEIPIDAVITGVYAVVSVDTSLPGGAMSVKAVPAPPGGNLFVGSGIAQSGTFYGANMGTLSGCFIEAHLTNSVPGRINLNLNVDFAGVAVYYTGTPKSKMTLLQEALGDVWVGAPAKIWFGLMNVGAATLLGVPYLVFSGVVDKPSVHVGLDTLSITLALENRLVNLQRANQRRYTAGDQKIYFPTDMAFNWVESLNDIALRWGS